MKKFMYDLMNIETGEMVRTNVETGDLDNTWAADMVMFFFSADPGEKIVNVREV